MTGSATPYGPIRSLMEDDAVEEVWINGSSQVFAATHGEHRLTSVVMESRELEDMVDRLLAAAGRRLDRSRPFVDARLPDGSRLHAVIPPVTEAWAVNIRKFVGLRATTLEELVKVGSLSLAAARFLDASVVTGANIVAAGPVGAGKTTLLNCLASSIPARERVVTCEDTFELKPDLVDLVAMQCRPPNIEGEGEVTLRMLVREAMRMRPDRIVVGEVRGAEAFDMLVALNAGCAGLTSVHANTAREALRKLVTLPLLAGSNIDPGFVSSTVASVVDLVVFCERSAGTGRRWVREVLAVGEQVAGGDMITAGTLFDRSSGDLAWTGETPRDTGDYARAGYDVGMLLREGAGT
ncbi:MAG: CpaF family protein [Acidimicrobiia bacterium]|nr:CpaF family protein [Acidimicrobiia bacterium]